MTVEDALTPWNDLAWTERDTPWAAGCRLLQGWWREEQGAPAGLSVKVGDRPQRLVVSMLPSEFMHLNLLNDGARRAREEWVKGGAGLVSEDRFERNLLSSQPLAFNVFGPLRDEPGLALGWVRSLDPDAERVEGVELEWAPDRKTTFGGGSAFDAAVIYQARGVEAPRLIGIECKYAENLSASSIKSILRFTNATTGLRPRTFPLYQAFTEDPDNGWRPDAGEQLDEKHLRQFWLNTMLVQKVAKDGGFDDGLSVVMACEQDASAVQATDAVRSQLSQPDSWLCWSPYNELLDTLGDQPWVQDLRRRYLDFNPVRAELRARGIEENR